MTTLVRLHEVSKEWNGNELFSGLNLEINEGERLAILGRNGCGKTTLLRIILGEEQGGGRIDRQLPLSEWGFMRQRSEVPSGINVLEAVRRESGRIDEVKRKLEELERRLSDADAAGDVALLDEYARFLEEYEQLNGYMWETEVEKVLTRLGLSVEHWSRPYRSLSGGQKTKARLAGLLVSKPRFLILDEPTNHLDEESMRWLEAWLSAYEGTVLFVSHDRTFIDRVATSVIEFSADKLTKYRGGYTDYKGHKERELKEQETLYRKQQLERKALEETIRNYQQWFHKAHNEAGGQEVKITQSFYKARANKNISRYHAKQKQLERLDNERVDKPREAAKLNMELQMSSIGARQLLALEEVNFSYDPKHTFLHDLRIAVERGDRLAVRGANGTGKSTLLKLMIGELQPLQGKVSRHPQLSIGYFSQELEGLPEDATLLDSLLVLPSMTQSAARTILGCFLFSREDVFKRIGNLSMGEKCRVAFLRLYFGGANLLVLDEPTNYLDIDTQEVMENVLQEASGALVIVSHDRMLVRTLANRLCDLKSDGTASLFEGGVADWEQTVQLRESALQTRDSDDERLRLEMRLSELLSPVSNAGTERERFVVTEPAAEMEAEAAEIRAIQQRLKELKNQGASTN
ncbi:ABC-F type ribosomal protection protein [Paenibacillus polysaccharolyticus]|uniref:ribosomal protection-like ABC-F family protein n=1 Tax=Paenibacillus polysaccharolyticus TaxID=582692 RepID=UPI00203EA9CC|nr:ABC-F type ribosomal protection protein [Paenibacillus polysaccharolyticus]MCM3131446.1 ABC-F type ribosomal protection protein [Paenibacillus polysaccharolyticus]